MLNRPTVVDENGLRETQTAYDDVNRTVTVSKDLRTFGDADLQSITSYDMLGRVTRVQTSDGVTLSGSNGIKVDTSYVNLSGGHWVVTSTPYRTTSDPTLEWTCTLYDVMNRVTSVAMYTGTAAPTDCTSATSRTGNTATSYDINSTGAVTTTTDPAGKARNQYIDGMKRLVKVFEDPNGNNYETDYAYDVLDNLKTVTQGSQTRTFAYSTLSRLTSAANPESGTTSYTYFDDGNLYTRTDARGYGVTYAYDDLKRVSTKTYSGDGGITPAVTYTYYTDTSPGIGQLQSVSSTSSAASTTYGGYDALGRAGTETETIAGNSSAFTFNYTYYLNDAMASMQYPSGKQINYSVDNAGRPVKAASASKTYVDLTASGITTAYEPDGRIAQMQLGNGLYETHSYQTPGTPTKLQLGTASSGSNVNNLLELEYDYSATQNNGNLLQHVIRQPGATLAQNYSYDFVNRLSAFCETTSSACTPGGSGTWGEQYNYDRYGNMGLTSSSLPTDANQVGNLRVRCDNEPNYCPGRRL